MQQLVTIPELLNMRNVLAERQRELYVATITNINMRYRELLTDDFGATLVKNCAWDAADAIVDRYFNTKDYYISTQQMYERICSFSYGNETDPLSDNTSIRKMLYENTNSRETLDEIARNSLQAQKKLFEKEDGRYKDHAMMTKAKQEYRQSKQGDLRDELTGTPQAKLDRPLEVDHTQAAATATYNSRYIKDPEAIEQLKKFYNSPSNFQMLQKSANASKSDVKVFSDGNKTISETAAFQEKRQRTDELRRQYQRDGMSQKDALKAARDEAQKELFGEGGKYTDITYKATAAQRTQATVEKWENANPTAKETLKRDGFLDENGKVKPEVKKELEEHYRNAMNGESRAMRPDYHAIAKDSMNAAKKSITKIIIGQVVYYVLPPLVFETRTLVRRKNMTLDVFFQEIKKSGRRIIRYVSKKLGDIFKNIAGNLFNKFLKSFFDILIELAKETVKRVLKVVKQLVLSLVNCVKIIADKNTSSAQKADSVSKLMAATVTTIALEILFEWMEKRFGLPDILMEPLQIIVTIIVTNVIMLILQKADLFDVQYGLLVSNIQMIFEQEQQAYLEESSRLEKRSEEEAKAYMEMLNKQISDLEDSLDGFDPFKDDAGEDLEKLNEIYQMDIDFKKEWLDFCNSHPAVGVY